MPKLFDQPVYLIDLACYKPPDEYLVDREEVYEIWRQAKTYTPDMQEFHMRVLRKSGLAKVGTYLPPAIHPRFCGGTPNTDLKAAHTECHMAVTGAVTALLARTGLRPDQIDIVVTTCSIYCPTPSMASMVVNHFKMRGDVHSYHLGGMGCSNGAVAVNFIHDLLQAHPNSNALFVTNETTTPAYYTGLDRSRQVTNMIFRMGAAAMLFSNKRSWGRRIKYKLLQHQRVHLGMRDEAYNAIMYSPDDVGINGISLGKNVVTEASGAIRRAMWRVGPHIMTWKQLGEYGATWLRQRLSGGGKDKVPDYAPAFGESVQHFLIHAGGAKVLEGIGSALRISDEALAPSQAVMHDYGNVSSSSTWYTLAFIETTKGVRKGDKLLQIGVGSGIKCGINVWQAQHHIRDVHNAWEHRLPEAERTAAGLAYRKSRRGGGGWCLERDGQALQAAFPLLLLLALLLVSALLTLSYRLGVRNALQQEL